MPTLPFRLALLGIVLAMSLPTAASRQETSQSSTKPKPAAIVIRPEPPRLSPGAPLSQRALVQRPLPLRGAASWSMESRRHRGYLVCMAASPDGKFLATGGLDGTIRIWETDSGKLVRALIGHDSYIYGLAWSPDGNTLASAGSFDASVRLWDTRSGQPLRVFPGMKEYVVHVAWSPDGKRLIAAGGESGFVWTYDAAEDRVLDSLGLGKYIYAVAWAPDGKTVAFGCRQTAVSLLDVASGKVTRTLGPPNEDIYAVAWSPDGRNLAASAGTVTHVWQMADAMEAFTLTAPAGAVAFSPDGKILASAPSGGAIQLWDAMTGKPAKTLPVSGNGFLWSPQGPSLIVREMTTIAFVDPATSKSRLALDVGGLAPPRWSAPGRPLLTGEGTTALHLWDPLGKSLRTLEHAGPVTAAAWSRDGKILAAADGQHIHLWDPQHGKDLRTLEGHGGAVAALAFAPDGKTLASGGADKSIRLWHPDTGKSSRTLLGHDAAITILAWSPDGKTLASGSADRTVRLWDAITGKFQRSLSEISPVQSLAWSPDGSRLASGGSEALVRVWQTSSGQLLNKLDSPGSPPNVSALAWSGNGALLASGRGNHTIQLWDGNTGKLVHSMLTMAPVQWVAFTPGSTTLATGNQERSVRFFDAATGQLRAVLLAEDKFLPSISTEGYYRAEAGTEAELVYVVLTDHGQDTYSPADFAAKFKWKNNPSAVRLTGN